jgi:heme A synthase
MFENRSAAQTNHRMLAYTTYITTMIACGVGFVNRRKLPRSVNVGLLLAALAVNSQVALT